MAKRSESVKINVFPVAADKEAWSDIFYDYIGSLHTSMYGQAMYCSTPEERRKTSDWYADAIVKALEHADVNSSG